VRSRSRRAFSASDIVLPASRARESISRCIEASATLNTQRSSWNWSSSRPLRKATRLPSGDILIARRLEPESAGLA